MRIWHCQLGLWLSAGSNLQITEKNRTRGMCARRKFPKGGQSLFGFCLRRVSKDSLYSDHFHLAGLFLVIFPGLPLPVT